MDAVAALLDGPRARDSFLLRVVLDAPWSMHIRDEAPLTLVAPLRGVAWVTPDGGAPVPVSPGDVAVVRGPEPYLVSDEPGREATVVVLPGEECVTLTGEPLAERMGLGIRTWGTRTDGESMMLIGTYTIAGAVGDRLLGALPRVLRVGAEAGERALVGLLAEEAGRDAPGQSAVLDRLLDVLLISTLRTWLGGPEADAPAWYSAQADPVVGRALALMHNEPARRWTVGSLAGEVGVSRATLARRFTELVGEPPMAFLTGWRLALAADMLRGSDAGIAAVARSVGYGSPFALSAAFTRERGVSPQRYREGEGGLPAVGITGPEAAAVR